MMGQKKRGQTTVRCRLNWALENANFQENFMHSRVNYLRLWGSDHRPVLENILSKSFRAKKKIKFDKQWLDCEDIRQVIQEG